MRLTKDIRRPSVHARCRFVDGALKSFSSLYCAHWSLYVDAASCPMKQSSFFCKLRDAVKNPVHKHRVRHLLHTRSPASPEPCLLLAVFSLCFEHGRYVLLGSSVERRRRAQNQHGKSSPSCVFTSIQRASRHAAKKNSPRPRQQEDHRSAWSPAVDNEALVAEAPAPDMVPRNVGRPRGAEAGLCLRSFASFASHLSNCG